MGMYRCDETLKRLKDEQAVGKDVSTELKAREKLLLPMYRQVSVMYCDLHDRSARMKGLGAIHEELEWRQSRTYLHWRIRRRLRESGVVRKLQASVPGLSHAEAKDVLKNLLEDNLADVVEDRAVAEWLETNDIKVKACVEAKRQAVVEEKIFELLSSLPNLKQEEVVRDLEGYTKVNKRGRN